MKMAKSNRAHKPSHKLDYDCAIIGGGPGGLVSALYLRRFRRKVLLFDSGPSRASWGKKVRNLIGYDQGISGKMLLKRIERQIQHAGGIKRIKSRASVTKIKAGFEICTDDNRVFLARTVILACGIDDVHPAIKNLEQLRSLGLLKYCSICDGYEMRNKPVVVIAQDDFGIQKAIFIGNWTKKIRIIVPRGFKLAPIRMKELKILGAKLMECDTFSLLPTVDNSALTVKLDCNRPFVASVAYVELGCNVKDSAFSHMKNLRRSKEGFLITTVEQRTSVKGLFAVGDCVNLLGQISVAAGQAAVAATTIHNDLLK